MTESAKHTAWGVWAGFLAGYYLRRADVEGGWVLWAIFAAAIFAAQFWIFTESRKFEKKEDKT